jgi:hypothetical protein
MKNLCFIAITLLVLTGCKNETQKAVNEGDTTVSTTRKDSPVTRIKEIEDTAADNKNDLPNTRTSENLQAINFNFSGDFSVIQETEETTTGTAYIAYNFSIKKDKAVLITETYHEPITCNGNYKIIENNNILELYYSGDDKNCQSTTPIFKIKKKKNTYFIQGVGGEATFNEWIQLKKTTN